MKVVHITPSFYPATYWGGPIYTLYGLCNALTRIPGVELRVLTTDSAGPRLEQRIPVDEFPARMAAGYDVYFCRRLAGADLSPGQLVRIWGMVAAADVVHLTGVYSPPTIPTLLACWFLRKPVVWSPHGSLQRYVGSTRLPAKRAWEWICNRLLDVKRCVLNVTSQEEAKTSAARIRNAGVKIIPNGVDIPDADQGRVWRPDGRTRLLFIGRLHPIKGIENLLQALARLPKNDYELQICGTGEAGYVSSLHQLAGKLGVVDRVTFSGYVDGSEKFRVFHNTDVCVVPSFTENFGNVAAESLALGVPVIASRGTPWREVEERGCGLWVDNSPESLWEAIHTMHARDLAEMGQRGRRWMEECFGWDMIAAQMYGVYEELLAPEYK